MKSIPSSEYPRHLASLAFPDRYQHKASSQRHFLFPFDIFSKFRTVVQIEETDLLPCSFAFFSAVVVSSAAVLLKTGVIPDTWKVSIFHDHIKIKFIGSCLCDQNPLCHGATLTGGRKHHFPGNKFQAIASLTIAAIHAKHAVVCDSSVSNGIGRNLGSRYASLPNWAGEAATFTSQHRRS